MKINITKLSRSKFRVSSDGDIEEIIPLLTGCSPNGNVFISIDSDGNADVKISENGTGDASAGSMTRILDIAPGKGHSVVVK